MNLVGNIANQDSSPAPIPSARTAAINNVGLDGSVAANQPNPSPFLAKGKSFSH
jgi:hypothetical protein